MPKNTPAQAYTPAPALASAPTTQGYGLFPNSPLTYYGGKKRLAAEIIRLMPAHSIYVEPYFGGGAVFFAKQPSYLEVINDINDNLVNFYRICKTRFNDLYREINALIYAESLFIWAKRVYDREIEADELQRAVAVFIVFNMSTNSNPNAGWRADNGTGGSHVAIVFRHKVENFCPWICQRLLTVQISCRDALKVIKQRDTKDTFFYLDPPYLNANQGHYSGFFTEDMRQLLDLLTTIKGKFLLSNYQSDILSQYLQKENWLLKEITMRKDISHRYGSSQKTEWLISNYSMPSHLDDLFTHSNYDSSSD